MQHITVYLLSSLVLIMMGGSFHVHDIPANSNHYTESVSLYSHNCNDHSNHPDILHTHACQHCPRISSFSTTHCAMCSLGGITIVDVIPAKQNIHHSNVDYLNKSEPRSPPFFV